MKLINDDFAFMILSLVSEIPEGKVISYKQLAFLSGYPKHIRQVAKVMANADYYGHYPCHRVVHEDGSLVPYWIEQKALLSEEGVNIKDEKVDMKIYRWLTR